jgi:hypothetical protein
MHPRDKITYSLNIDQGCKLASNMQGKAKNTNPLRIKDVSIEKKNHGEKTKQHTSCWWMDIIVVRYVSIECNGMVTYCLKVVDIDIRSKHFAASNSVTYKLIIVSLNIIGIQMKK